MKKKQDIIMNTSFFRLIKKSEKKQGLAPGTLVHIGEHKTEKTTIQVLDYNEETVEEKNINTVSECFSFKETASVTWINVNGLHELETIEAIGKHFDIHPLALEDIVHTGQRPKIEDFDGPIFIILKMLFYEESSDYIHEEQVSLVTGRNFVISFQEIPGDIFDPVRKRIHTHKARIRKRKSDYLTYALLDTIVDNYFIVLEKIGEKMEDLDNRLLEDNSRDTLQTINDLKRKVLSLRKNIWPLREVIGSLLKEDYELFEESTAFYLKDVQDHIIQLIDFIEIYREMLSGMLDTYFSNLSIKMNEVMKVLTVIATIFIPLTFIAGIYGMNFKYMPELEWKGGYFVVWGIIICVTIVMVFYLRRKKWI